MGVTPEQLETVADQIEVIVFGPNVKGFAVNINAVPQPNTAMPSAAEATSQLQQIGGKVGQGPGGHHLARQVARRALHAEGAGAARCRAAPC